MRGIFFFPLLCALIFASETYDEARMKRQFNAALATVKQILNTTRHPQFPVDVPHTYQDKYSLAEFLTNTALAAQLNALSTMGLRPAKAARVQGWVADNQAVSVGFRGRQSCVFSRNESAQVGDGQRVTTITTNGKDTTIARQTFSTVVTYFYTWSFAWQFIAYQGTASTAQDNDARYMLLDSRNITFEVKTTANYPPSGCETQVLPILDVDLTWLFKQLDASNSPQFVINRGDKNCHTPRRNDQIDEAFSFFDNVNSWSQQALLRLPGWSSIGLSTQIFVPVIPLFEDNCNAGSNSTPDCVPRVGLSAADLNAFLDEQVSSLRASANEAAQSFALRTNSSAQISSVEALLATSLQHQQRIAEAYEVGLNSIEGMLTNQLVAAIGKEVSPQDFGEYIRFNNKRLFKPDYRPQDLSYSVRRPDHYPEGVVEIQQADSSLPLPFPIQSLVRVDRPSVPMNTTLTGGTVVSLMGDRYLHAAVFYQFSGQGQIQLNLAARARQFSSFVLLVGSMISVNEFRADIGIIIKDKDDLTIPLLMETIPTPKAFRDAIESLSPEQQAFAKAFRSMQLSNTLFAFAIIQVKPQLEKLMKLPSDSLTKEIQLTQDLMRLFLDYQIPSDLLSFQGAEDLEAGKKIDYVKAQVAQMNTFIESEKQVQIKEKQQKDEMRRPPVSKISVLSSDFEMAAPMASVSYLSRGMEAPKMFPRASMGRPAPASLGGSFTGGGPPPTPVVTTTRPAPPSTSIKQVALTKVADYTAIPAVLDARVLELDEDASLRATILKPGQNWYRQSQKGLLGERTGASLSSDSQTTERQKAFDLLEALSKSGIMVFEEAEFHVVIGSTQNFDQTILDTVIQQNENPIDQFERSNLIVATTVLGLPAVDLVAQDQVPRLSAFSPRLFPDSTTPPDQ